MDHRWVDGVRCSCAGWSAAIPFPKRRDLIRQTGFPCVFWERRQVALNNAWSLLYNSVLCLTCYVILKYTFYCTVAADVVDVFIVQARMDLLGSQSAEMLLVVVLIATV